jgi:hypothetical protein
MKEIPLTKGKVALVDDEDFEEVSKVTWYLVKIRNTCYAHGYVKPPSKKMEYMNRLILKTPEDMETDHINGNGLDNRKENLRVVTHRQNMQNIHIQNKSYSVVGDRKQGFRIAVPTDTGVKKGDRYDCNHIKEDRVWFKLPRGSLVYVPHVDDNAGTGGSGREITKKKVRK